MLAHWYKPVQCFRYFTTDSSWLCRKVHNNTHFLRTSRCSFCFTTFLHSAFEQYLNNCLSTVACKGFNVFPSSFQLKAVSRSRCASTTDASQVCLAPFKSNYAKFTNAPRVSCVAVLQWRKAGPGLRIKKPGRWTLKFLIHIGAVIINLSKYSRVRPFSIVQA